MSKPVTNVEIEDVLSSIRRLVSSSDRVERSVETSENEDVERLVLTPSLRVDDDADQNDVSVEEQDVTTSNSSENQQDSVIPDDESLDVDDKDAEAARLDEIAQALSEDSGDAAAEDVTFDTTESDLPDTSEPAVDLDALVAENTDNSSGFEDAALADDELSAEFAAAEDASEADDLDADMDAVLATGEQDLQTRAAEFETVVAGREDHWDPDGTTEDDNAGTRVSPLLWMDHVEGAEDTAVAPDDEVDMALAAAVFRRSRAPVPKHTDEDTGSDNVEAADTSDMDTESAGAIDDAESAKTSEQSDTVDLDRVMADLAQDAIAEQIGTAFDATDALSDEDGSTDNVSIDAEPAAFAFRSQATDDAGEGDGAVAAESKVERPLPMDEALLDEDALRDMVSEIVRQELQGALGERITRNVRKLVRREIHRALASQELE